MKTWRNISLSAVLATGLALSSFTVAAQPGEKAVKFDGTVSSYNESAGTIKVDGETYQVLPTSRITKENGAASSSALSTGQHVAGSYKQSAEGTREIIALDVTQAASGGGNQAHTFQGKVTSYDPSAKTITVGNQTYQLLATSRISDSNSRASADALAVGQQVDGRYKESVEGKREVLSLEVTRDSASAIGGTQDTITSESGSSFEGKVGKIDRKAKTFTIDGKTYQVLPTTRLVGKRGAAVELSDLKADQRVEGTYKESSRGKREVLTLDVQRHNASATDSARDRVNSESGATFQGKVDRINRDDRTFAINGQTYQILPTSRISDRNGGAVAMSTLDRDQRVQGTYHQSAEGKREVLTLEVGR